jgi:hypothetical protein
MSQSLTDFSESTAAVGFSVVPASSYSDDAIPNVNIAPQTLDPSSAIFTTTTANPSLSSASQSSLGMTGGAAGNTTSANPTISTYSSDGNDALEDASQLFSTVGQWGGTLAGLITGKSSTSNVTDIGSSVPATMSNTTKLLLVGLGVLVIFLLLED